MGRFKIGKTQKYDILSDGELVALLKEDNHDAFAELLERYTALLINFAYRRLNDLPLAEDLISDLWIDLWEKRVDQPQLDNILPLLFTIVKNRIIDHYRRQLVSQKYIDSFQKFQAQHQETDYLVRQNQLSELIEKEIAALPDNMRKVFELHRQNNMTRKEVAEHLNMRENSVKGNMQRALKILKIRLGKSAM